MRSEATKESRQSDEAFKVKRLSILGKAGINAASAFTIWGYPNVRLLYAGAANNPSTKMKSRPFILDIKGDERIAASRFGFDGSLAIAKMSILVKVQV